MWHWRGPSPYHFVTVPGPESDQLRATAALLTYGWGMIPVRVTIGETQWETSLWPKDGLYVLPLKDKIRKAERIGEGDTVMVRLSPTGPLA